jgi:diguanylate cyclase (GGDEF)-like protein
LPHELLHAGDERFVVRRGWIRVALEAVGNPIAILFVDLDEFKALNSKLTEVKVDETILPDIQHMLAKLVQGRGEAYRHGGEEFVIVVPNLDAAEAVAFGETVRGAFEQRTFATGNSEERVTVSVGIGMLARAWRDIWGGASGGESCGSRSQEGAEFG